LALRAPYRVPGSQPCGKRECAREPLADTLHWRMLPLPQRSVLSPHDGEENSAEAKASAQLSCDWLHAASDEPVIIVDAASESIVQANPAAAGLFRTTPPLLVGTKLSTTFEASSAAKVRRCLSMAQTAGSARTAAICARDGAIGLGIQIQVSLVRASPKSYFLVRLEPNMPRRQSNGRSGTKSVVFDAIDAAPVGFLIAEAEFRVDYANRAFVEMVGAESHVDVCGNVLTRWLRLTDADLSQLRVQLSQRQAATVLTAQLCPARGRPRRVEVCAVPVPDGHNTCWGFTVRNLPRLN
jgi:nitrogen-specific signal transduction histidine kinase